MPLNNCNEAQLQAVKHFTGPMLLIAGPGSGKTFTIIERIRYLIEIRGTEPSQILVITFTKAAAAEMEQRFIQAVKGKGGIVNFGTFHAVYFHILRQTYQYNSQNIITEKEKKEYLKQVLKKVRKKGGQEESELTEHLLNEFGKVKNSIGGIEKYVYESGLMESEEFGLIYRRYREICIKERKMDFDDMALQCLNLFRKRSDILKKWQRKFPFIMIDEFQDINLAQYEVIRLLSGEEKNLTVVGDDDQSIYGFRGADPSVMKKFLDDFPKAEIVMLERNYRSAEPIIQLSMQIIKENNDRFPKTIQAGTDKNGEVRIKSFPTKEAEHNILIRELKIYQERGEAGNCAVICRTNKGVGEIKALLKKEKIPYVGEEQKASVYDHFIVKDLEDYIRFARGDKRRERFLRIMNKPSRYFTRDSIAGEIVDFQNMKQYYSENEEYIEKISKLEEQMQQLQDLSPYLAVNYIRKAIDYDGYLKEQSGKSEELLETADLIQQSAAKFRSMEEWLCEIEDQRRKNKEGAKKETKDMSDGNGKEEEKVTVITMHGAKGLEYQTVFLPDVNDGTVPYGRHLSKAEEEEERRIFYVAVTRAKERLEIFYVENDRTKPSRFLPEKQKVTAL